jgi:hypothetical protein
MVRAIGSATLCLVLMTSSINASRAEDVDLAPYTAAAEYCSGSVPRPLALSPDRQLLCFNGMIPADLDPSTATELTDNGIAVFRSDGGDRVAAARLANVLRDRHATIVIRDHCLLVCASFIVIASSQTYVLRDALVAWGVLPLAPDHKCRAFIKAEDHAGLFLTSARCPGSQGPADRREIEYLWSEFYLGRMASPAFTDPPESRFVRKALMDRFESTNRYPVVLWTWNPRYYAKAIKTKLIYQHYPDNQDEVDEMVSRLGLTIHVIHDP